LGVRSLNRESQRIRVVTVDPVALKFPRRVGNETRRMSDPDKNDSIVGSVAADSDRAR
jgi:hypothetical protein